MDHKVDPAPFSVLIHTGECEVIVAATQKLFGEFQTGLRFFASISISSNADEWSDPIAEVFTGDSVISTNLIDYLARELGQVRFINLVAIVAVEHETEVSSQLDMFVSKLKDVIGEMSQAVCRDFRIAFPAYGAEVPRVPFFTQKADANLIAIPRDSSSHDSMAKPISKNKTEEFAEHIAVELATCIGLWLEMDDSIVDDVQRINPGTDDVIVRWVSSRASYLVCPPLPIDRLMSEEGELPLPHGFHPVPDPQQAVERLARLVYPAELRYEPNQPPSGPEYSELGKKLRWRYLSEFGRAAIQVPRALFKGVQDHLEGVAGAALQEAVGSSESSIEVIYPGRYVDEDSVSQAVSNDMVQKIIDDVGERVDRPVLTTIGEGLWVNIVDKVIAVADGGLAGVDVRAGFADEKYLLVEQTSLASMSDDLVDLLHDIHVEPKKLISVQLEDLENSISPADPENPATEESNFVDEVGAATEDDAQPQNLEEANEVESHSGVMYDEVEVSALSKVVSGSESSHGLPAQITEEENENPIANPDDVDATPKVLLREISGLLAIEQEEARSRAHEMVQVLLSMPHQFKPRDARTISTSVRVAVALGFSILYFTFGSLTERRHLVNFESIGASTRDMLWVLLSTLVVAMAGFGLFLKTISKSQGRIIGSVTGVVVLLGGEFVFWKSIRDFVLRFEALKASAIIGALIMLGALVVVALSFIRNRFSEIRLRRMYATTLLGVAWLYVLVGVTAVMGSDDSAFRNLTNTTENRLVLMLLITSFTLVMVSAFVVAYTIVKERYRLNEAKRQLQWASAELAESADAERLLRLASVQWLGTAAVIARLFRFPLGSDFSMIRPDIEPVDESSAVLKFEQRPLILTKRGEQGLSARLRQLFIGQGWLGRQYRQLILRFQDDFAFSRGLQVSEVRSERPEGCSALPTLDDVFSGRARGPRWGFLRNVFAGEYDSALLDTTSEVQLEDAYSSIVVDPEAHSVGSTSYTAKQFFGKLIPSREVQIPRGLVSVLFSGTDERRLMTPYVWWPEELLQRPDGDLDELEYRASPVLTPSRITDPIKLFGACVLVSHPFKLDDISAGAGGVDDGDNSEPEEPTWGGGLI